MSTVRTNILKSAGVLFGSNFAIIGLLLISSLPGAFTIENFPTSTVIQQNLSLLIPVSIPALIFSPIFGYVTTKAEQNRFLKLFILAMVYFWFCAIATLLFMSGSELLNEGFMIIVLSFVAMVAMAIFVLPVLIPGVYLLEKWTHKKTDES